MDVVGTDIAACASTWRSKTAHDMQSDVRSLSCPPSSDRFGMTSLDGGTNRKKVLGDNFATRESNAKAHGPH